MEFLTELWIPILVAAVLVYVASTIIHMVLPIHKGDVKKMPGEDEIMATMRSHGLTPGQYMLPCPESMADMKKPEVIEKYKQGPVGYFTVIPSGPPAMGKNLVQWFLYTVLIGVFAGYVAWHGLGVGAHYLAVFRLTGSVAFAAYALGALPASIWWGAPWKSTLKFVFDGLIYSLLTAGAFGWLWP